MTKLLSVIALGAVLSSLSVSGTSAQQAPDSSARAKAVARRTSRKESAATERREEKGERHPRIHAAIRELEESRKELQSAAHDFGGHRVDAIKAVDEAVKQLRLALQYDK